MQLTLFTTHKRCTKCGQTKPLTQYNLEKRGRDGRRAKCKECDRARSRAWYEANAEHVRAKARAWHEANPERARARNRAWYEANPERARARARTWRKSNPEHIRVRNRAWYEANAEHVRAKARAWNEANPERKRDIVSRRRARKATAVPQRWRLSECPDHLCYWCGTELTHDNTHLDHIMPLSLGGPHTPDNTANTCAPCNLTKNNKHPLVWIAQLVTEN